MNILVNSFIKILWSNTFKSSSSLTYKNVDNIWNIITWMKRSCFTYLKEWKMDWLHSKMFGLVDIDAISCKKVQIKIRNIHTKNNWHNHVPISHSLQNPFHLLYGSQYIIFVYITILIMQFSCYETQLWEHTI